MFRVMSGDISVVCVLGSRSLESIKHYLICSIIKNIKIKNIIITNLLFFECEINFYFAHLI